MFLWGSLAGFSVAVRPSSSFDYISNTVSPKAALSSQNTISQIKSKSNLFSKLFTKTSLPPTALLGDKRKKPTKPIQFEKKKSKAIKVLKKRYFSKTETLFKAARINVSTITMYQIKL